MLGQHQHTCRPPQISLWDCSLESEMLGLLVARAGGRAVRRAGGASAPLRGLAAAAAADGELVRPAPLPPPF